MELFLTCIWCILYYWKLKEAILWDVYKKQLNVICWRRYIYNPQQLRCKNRNPLQWNINAMRRYRSLYRKKNQRYRNDHIYTSLIHSYENRRELLDFLLRRDKKKTINKAAEDLWDWIQFIHRIANCVIKKGSARAIKFARF